MSSQIPKKLRNMGFPEVGCKPRLHVSIPLYFLEIIEKYVLGTRGITDMSVSAMQASSCDGQEAQFGEAGMVMPIFVQCTFYPCLSSDLLDSSVIGGKIKGEKRKKCFAI